MALTATWRKTVLLLVTILVAVAMMVASAMPVLAAPQNPDNKSRNSCGASNPNIDHPPNVQNKVESGEFTDCGYRNNPNS